MRMLPVFAVLLAVPAAAQTAPFTSVALHDGGEVVVRPGNAPGVRFVAGDERHTRVTITAGRLVIENCPDRCPHDYAPKIEVVMPMVTALSVSDGGTIRVADSFPAQDGLSAEVEQGGAIDIRSLHAAAVDAQIRQGGRIFTIPSVNLRASVAHGGHITYWGDARVALTVTDGGAVTKGSSADRGKSLAELAPRLPALPPVPPLPSVANLH